MFLSCVTDTVASNPISTLIILLLLTVIGVIIGCWRKQRWLALLLIAVSANLLYLLFPLLLREEGYVFTATELYFSGLRHQDYKSSFIESVGGMLGSFLAIVAALWTQHFFEQQKEEKEAIENARVIYYDFKFAFNEVREKLQQFLATQSITEANYTKHIFNLRDPYKAFDSYQISIDRDWIRNVSKLPDCFTPSEIEDIYYVYGAITALNLALSSGGCSVNDPLLKFYAIIPGDKTIKTNKIDSALSEREKKTLNVWNKLKDTAKIIDSTDTPQA